MLKHALRHDKPTTTQVKLSLNYYENSTREAWCAYYSSYLKHTFLYENNTKQGQIHKAQSTPLNNKFLVSKETVVLRRWERSKQNFGFIKRVDKGDITTVKDLES